MDIKKLMAERLKARHGDKAQLRFCDNNFKGDIQDDGSMRIPGMASTSDVDRDEEIISPKAFESSIDDFLSKNPVLLFQHGWSDMPLGKIEKAEIRPNGLWIDPVILPTTVGKDVMKLVNAGVLRHFSVGFRAKKSEFDEETDIRTITDLELLEVSVVNIPANPEAVFDKDLETAIKSLTPKGNQGDTQMDQDQLALLKTLEGKVGTFDETESAIKTSIADLTKNHEELQKMIKLVQDEATKLNTDKVSMSDYKLLGDRMKTDLTDVMAKIEEGLKAPHLVNDRIPFKDWRGLVGANVILVRDANGVPLPDAHQRAYKLFNLPIEKESVEASEIIMMRDLHDTLVIKMAYMAYKNPRWDPRTSQEYGYLQKLVERHDPILAKAMYSTGTNLGDEWVPTEFSQEMEDLQRLSVGLEDLFRSWDMPSNPATWPFKASGATASRFAEAAVNNPDEHPKTSFGTDNVSFNAKILGAVLPVSPELIEDSIVDMASEIRKELVFATNTGIDSAILRGDTTATHRDTSPAYDTTNPESSWIGLFYTAVDRTSATFDSQSASAGVGDGAATWGAQDMRYLRTLMGAYGEKPEELVYIMSIDVWYLAMSFTQVAANAQNTAPSTWQIGTLPSLDAIPLRTTASLKQTYNTTGVDDGANNNHSICILANHRKWMMGSKRGFTLEFEKNIRTQQLTFVITTRKDFQTMTPAADNPVTVALNIE